jgi:hypothetical protein
MLTEKNLQTDSEKIISEVLSFKALQIMLSFALLVLCGCKSTDPPIFDLKAEEPTASETKIQWTLRGTALPTDTDTSQGLEESSLPLGSLYLMVVPDPFDASLFRVDVRAQNLRGVYDTPMTIAYDPTVIEVLNANPGVQILEGPPSSRLRKELEPGLGLTRLSILLAAKDPERTGRILISQSLLVDLGTNQVYQGNLFSIPMRILSVSGFKTTLGFEISSSQVLNREGVTLEVPFFGGTMTRSL